jgi:hypothetical protein
MRFPPSRPSPSNRPAGRPHHGNRIGTPGNLERIRIWWMEGVSQYQIAKRLQCTPETVHYHLIKSVLPEQRTIWEARREEVIAKVDHLYSTAWTEYRKSQTPQRSVEVRRQLGEQGTPGQLVEKVVKAVQRNGEVNYLDLVRWCLDWYSKTGGYYRAERIEIETEFRVAGKTRAQVDAEMLAHLHERIKARKEHEEAMQAIYGPPKAEGNDE